MTYVFSDKDSLSTNFHVMYEVLMDDPPSPTFLNIFLSILCFCHDLGDIELMEIIIFYIKHADNMVLCSYIAHGIE